MKIRSAHHINIERFTSMVAVGSLLLALYSVLGCKPNQPALSETMSNPPAIERTTEKGPVKLTVRITPASPRLSDLVTMEVDVNAEENVEIQSPKFGQAVGEFLIRDYSERTEGSTGGPSPKPHSNHRRFQYQLEPTHAGRHLIRSVAIEFLDQRPQSENAGQMVLIESDPIEVEVTSELGDDVPDLDQLEPIPHRNHSKRLWHGNGFLLFYPWSSSFSYTFGDERP